MYVTFLSFITLTVRRNYGAAGDYSNTSNNRIKDTLAKASSILLDDPFSNDGSTTGGGFNMGGAGGSSAYGGIPPPIPGVYRHSSQPPAMMNYAKSNYTGSEAGDSEFETHSQFNQKRKQWGAPLGSET